MSDGKDAQQRPGASQGNAGNPGGPQGEGAMKMEETEMGYVERDQVNDQEQLQRFLNQMDDYTPTIPDAVTNYYLRTAGFDCPDERVVRMVSLAAQKFIADIANEVMQKQKANQAAHQHRMKTKNQKANQAAHQYRMKIKDKKYVLTMDDLQFALGQQGIHVNPPAYFK